MSGSHWSSYLNGKTIGYNFKYGGETQTNISHESDPQAIHMTTQKNKVPPPNHLQIPPIKQKRNKTGGDRRKSRRKTRRSLSGRK